MCKRILIIVGCTVFFSSCKNEFRRGDGSLQSTCSYESGEYCCEDYYRSGVVQAEYCLEGDQITGIYKKYYENSKLAFELEIDHERLIKINKYYTIEGKVLENKRFLNGNGEVIIYYPDGKLKEKGQYANGYKEGTWQSFAKNGDVIGETQYEHGVMLGGYFSGEENVSIWDDGL